MKINKTVVSSLCDVFQDLVDLKEIEFSNDDKPQDEPKTTIYGDDWDYLLKGITNILESDLGFTVSSKY